MMKMRFTSSFFALAVLLVLLAGCKTGGSNPNGQSSNEDLADLPRSAYNFGKVSFSMADIPGLDPMHRDSVSWGHLLPQTEDNGPIGYYFVNDDRTLSAPQIRMEYINKSLPEMGSPDQIFSWLKSVFINPMQGGELKSEGEKVKTMDGQEVEILEIIRPAFQESDSIARSLKLMAWAYIDHDDRYVALNLTAIDESDYNKGFPMFKDLIRSYKDEK